MSDEPIELAYAFGNDFDPLAHRRRVHEARIADVVGSEPPRGPTADPQGVA